MIVMIAIITESSGRSAAASWTSSTHIFCKAKWNLYKVFLYVRKLNYFASGLHERCKFN